MATTKEQRERLRRLASGDVLSQPTVDAARALLDERGALEAKEGSARETAMRWGRELQEQAARVAALEAERDGLARRHGELGAAMGIEQSRRVDLSREVDALKRELIEARDSLIREGMERDAFKRELAREQQAFASGQVQLVDMDSDLRKVNEALRAARADMEEAAVLLSVAMSAGMDGTLEREVWRERRDALLAKHRSYPAPVSAAPTGPTTRAVCSHPSWADNGYCHTCGQKVRGNRTEEFPLRTTAPPAPCCPVALETHGLSHGDACPAGAGKGTP